MGDKLRLVLNPPDKFNLTRINSAGEVVYEKTTNEKEHQVKSAAKVLGVSWVELMRWIGDFKRSKKPETTIDLNPEPEKQPAVFLLRGIKEPASEGLPFPSIWPALEMPYPADDPVVEWDGTEEYCILDLDFHKGDYPDVSDLRQCADTIRPMPLAWWFSRSGGLHLLYTWQSPLSACELASLVAVRFLSRFPAARIELKNRTRQPTGEVFRSGGTNDIGRISTVAQPSISSVRDFSDYLTERGYEIGKRYPHTLCPVNPSPRAEGNSPPVVIAENYIKCHICEADGIRRGSQHPGYFPLAVLAGTVQESMFRRCVENFTHWDHARYIVGQVVQQENLAALVYRAALKQKHGDDPRIPLVWAACPKTGLIRYDGYWAGESGRAKTYGPRSPVLEGLPVCKYKDEDGELKTDRRVVEELASGDDLSPYGYPAMVRVWGLQLTQCQEQPTTRIFTILQRNGTPEFLSVARRMPEGEAWQTLEGLYPGLNRRAVELLIVAKGCTEFRAGLPPMIFLTGPTGAGKTQSIHLAATICGDAVTTVTFSSEEDRLRQQILQAKERGSFAFFDEYLKRARARHIEPDQALEFVLNLTPDSVSHKLYVGPVALGDLPVCVFADTALPNEVVAHSQIARRIHHVPLRDSKQWNRATKDLRQEGEEYIKAADSILSWIIDRWFPPPGPTDFAEVAKSLGFHLFNSNEAAKEKEDRIRQFFALVCAAPNAKDGGWKSIDPNGTGELTESWLALADSGKPASRALTEVDLRRVLGLSEYVECEIQGVRTGRVMVRFTNKERGLVNEDFKRG